VEPAIYAADATAPRRGEHTADVVLGQLGHGAATLREWQEAGLV
jgi:hypothetical protein